MSMLRRWRLAFLSAAFLSSACSGTSRGTDAGQQPDALETDAADLAADVPGPETDADAPGDAPADREEMESPDAPDATDLEEDLPGDLPPEQTDLPPDAPCQDECPAEDALSCKDIATVQECQYLEDGCRHWVTVETCQESATCVEGACEGGGTGGECADIMNCLAKCGKSDAICRQGCIQAGTPAAKAAFEAVQECASANCADVQSQHPKLQLCLLESCTQVYGACSPYGTASCSVTFQCIQGCSGIQECVFGCMDEASWEAQVTLAKIQVCFGEKCPDCTAGDFQCFKNCGMQSCPDQIAACQAS